MGEYPTGELRMMMKKGGNHSLLKQMIFHGGMTDKKPNP